MLINDGAVIDPSDPDPNYVAVPKVLYCIESGDVLDPDENIDTLYQLSVNPEFDGETPLFWQYMHTTFHADDVERVLDLLAYSLAPRNPRQEAVMLVGSGGNGKGLLLRLLSAMFRDQDVKSVSLQAMAKDKIIRKAGNDTRVAGYNGQPDSMPEIKDVQRNQQLLLSMLKSIRVEDDAAPDCKLTRSEVGRKAAAARYQR